MFISGCVGDPQSGSQNIETASLQPARATYDCGEDGSITIENMRTAVRLSDAEGESYNLPASPPTQASRYGEGGLALVIEDREALWMKAGSEPLTCRR